MKRIALIDRINRIKNKVKFSSKDIIVSRNKICSKCEYIMKFSRCKKCGCFMDIKTMLSKAKCPIGRW
jgi:hypothetical protein